ncbi:hypothetical protein IPH25_04800 [bacterium]|nr:MAG: hypothetical protein IPG37_01800 [bacterium]QQR61757.1 MAG: hypothetical protein IPH25_04800 [bacterium]QQR62669.1 MAG: hypothetical protein IPH67_04610 [bacterium]
MSRRGIGRKLCIHHSTIAREIKRNSSKKGYKFQEAEEKKQKRRSAASSRSYRLTKEIQEKIKGSVKLLVLV